MIRIDLGIIILVTTQVLLVVLYGLFISYDNTEERGTGGNRNVMASLYDVHFTVFISFGMLMTFLKRYTFGGMAFNVLVGSMILEWAIFFYGIAFRFEKTTWPFKVVIDDSAILQADMAVLAVVISMGAIMGSASYSQLLMMGVVEVCAFSANDFVVERYLNVLDFGHSVGTHMFGGFFGICVSMALNKGQDIEEDNESGYVSDAFSTLGTLLLWITWPSLSMARAVTSRVIIQTYISLASSCVATFFMSWVYSDMKFNIRHIQNATLAGGVAIGAVADLKINCWGAMIIGVLSGVISVVGFVKIRPVCVERMKIQDVRGIFNVHALPGLMSGFISAIMAVVATPEEYGDVLYSYYPARRPSSRKDFPLGLHNPVSISLQESIVYNRPYHMQALYQILYVICTLFIASLTGTITGFIIRLKPCRPMDDVKLQRDINQFTSNGEMV